MSKTRQDWVDIAKGIAIIAVVVGHIGFKWPNAKLLPLSDLCVWLWHVPVFFMIGGFFIKDEKLQSPSCFIKGKIKGLYLPMIYIYFPVLLAHNIFINMGWYDLYIEYYGKYVTYWGVTDFFRHLVAALLCAGREPLLGAMWFGFVLFMALCIMSLASWGIKKIGQKWKDSTLETARGLVFLSLAIASCSCTKLLGFTIPRFNNTFVAIWLIYVGWILVQKVKVTFSNTLIAASCGLVAWHSATIMGGVDLVANEFSDVITLTITSSSCLYVVCYLSKQIEKHKWAIQILSSVGRESLYIMGLHFVGFKIATVILNLFGVNINIGGLVPRAGDNILLFLIYIIFGVGIPMVIVFSFRGVRFIEKFIRKI